MGDHFHVADLPRPTRDDFAELIRWLESEAGEMVQIGDEVREYQPEWEGSAMATAGATVAARRFLDLANDRRQPEARSLVVGGNQWFQTSSKPDSRLYQAMCDARLGLTT